jgi:hypothetical protein
MRRTSTGPYKPDQMPGLVLRDLAVFFAGFLLVAMSQPVRQPVKAQATRATTAIAAATTKT